MKTPKSGDNADGDSREEEEKENSLRGFVLPRKSRHEHAKKTYCQGRWSNEERLLFLKGMRRFGAGQWKEIGLYVTTRSISQIKSHGQTAVRQMKAGEGIFQELTIAEANGVAPQSPANLLAVVSDTTKRASKLMMDPATTLASTTAPATTTTNGVTTIVMTTVQEDSISTTAPVSSMTSTTTQCDAQSTANLPRSWNELLAAEALCVLKTTTPHYHGEVVDTTYKMSLDSSC